MATSGSWSTCPQPRLKGETMGLSTAYRTMQDIEQERSEGTVQTMNSIFGMLGLKLGVVRTAPDQHHSP
jgi:hypothetical protein